MDTVRKIIQTSTDYYNEIRKDENGRYRSWEHCYEKFYNARKDRNNVNHDYLSLQLAFYLASWGMYRGSSFLLQKDYKIHSEVVKELIKEEYDPLLGIECVDLKELSNQMLLKKLTNFMRQYYSKVRISVKGQQAQTDISATLLTKILLGTLGCVPAYDRYFISGIKHERVATGKYSKKSLLKLIEFYENNREMLEPVRKTMQIGSIEYPQMKMLDMGFWQIGFEEDVSKNKL